MPSHPSVAELREILLRSPKFLHWQPSTLRQGDRAAETAATPAFGSGQDFTYLGKRHTNLVVDERHFTPAELADAWGISAETVRQLFRDEPGVLKIGDNGTKYKRGYKTLRIPQSVAERVHTKLSA